MKLVAPDYYEKFVCIAGSCRHSCCIGWEIDIDSDTLQYYQSVEGGFGSRLAQNIAAEGESVHFCLVKDDRCPFLNSEGLCDIIINLGQEALCQICDDHPRFRNFYSDREEIGLGLCCEAAAQLILSQTQKTQLVVLDDDEEILWEEENEFLALRSQLWQILQDRTITVEQRIKTMLGFCGIEEQRRTPQQWVQIYRRMEQLDPIRDKLLDRLEQAEETHLALPQEHWMETALEQLIVYFTYRHLTESLDDGRFAQRLQFAVQSWRVVKWFCALHFAQNGSIALEDMAEYARIYSAEIEYSTDNIERLLKEF